MNLDDSRPFASRSEAGAELATRLREFKDRNDVVVLGLPRGGVPVAHEVARALHAPLDVFLVHKLGLPGHPELAMGAIASGGVRVLNEDVADRTGVPASVIDEVARAEQAELERRERVYRDGRAPVPLRDRIVLLIDDGLATGSTMKAAVEAVPRTCARADRRRRTGRCTRDVPRVCRRRRCSCLRAHSPAVLRRRPLVSRLLSDDGL